MFDLKEYLREHAVYCPTMEQRLLVLEIIANKYPDDDFQYVDEKYSATNWPYLAASRSNWALWQGKPPTHANISCAEFMARFALQEEPETQIENLSAVL